MTGPRTCWKRRLALPLCVIMASGELVAWGDELAAPRRLAVSVLSGPIKMAGHTADADDPPPAPPFGFTPEAPQSGQPVMVETLVPGAPATLPPQPIDESTLGDAPTVAIESADGWTERTTDGSASPLVVPGVARPVLLGEEPPRLEGLEEVPEVNITAPIPAEAPQTDLVQERYPNGSLKIAREVTQDREGNFINHGSWKEWNLQGELVSEGEYRHGVRHGVWRRVLKANESPLFSAAPYNQYKGPFLSEAQLQNGKLHGVWTISDAQGRKISEIEFSGGLRNGLASWYHANERKMQQINFREGVAIEDILTWRPDGSLAAKEEYRDGRKVESKTEYYAPNRRKSTGDYLSPKMVITKEDDWWNCRLADFTPEGKSVRHGAWTSWHANGQVQVEGRFQFDKPEGEFTWYHPNGQKRTEGSYRNGQSHGPWTWWHENGLKSSVGKYIDGKPAGHWTWWGPDGKVAQKADFADGIPVQAIDADDRNAVQATLPSLYHAK